MSDIQMTGSADKQIMDIELLLQGIDNELIDSELIDSKFEPTTSMKDFLHNIGVEMVAQPPSNVRKSNFFNFSIRFYDGRKNPVKIKYCSFHSFCDNEEANGVIYKASLEASTGEIIEKLFNVKLLHSASSELICLDSAVISGVGVARVLVTHGEVCSRCSQGRVCGSSLESPTDPEVNDQARELKIFLKCNQNCLRGPGNPKGSRRFRIAVFSSEHGGAPLCSSQPIFVHNNSKHTKTKSFTKTESDSQQPEDKRSSPRIIAISPSEGWTIGGQTIVIIGDNFKAGMQVIFGGVPLQCQLISSHAVRVQSPGGVAGVVEVTLALGPHQYNISCPGTFKYISTSEPGLDLGFSRLGRLVPRLEGDPARLGKEVILERAANMITTQAQTQSSGAWNNKANIEELLLAPWITDLQDYHY